MIGCRNLRYCAGSTKESPSPSPLFPCILQRLSGSGFGALTLCPKQCEAATDTRTTILRFEVFVHYAENAMADRMQASRLRKAPVRGNRTVVVQVTNQEGAGDSPGIPRTRNL